MTNPFDDFTRRLARYGDSLALDDVLAQLDERVVQGWLNRELTEKEPAWIVTDLADELSTSPDRAGKLRVTLEALTADSPQATVWYALADALRRCCAKEAIAKAKTLLWVDGWLEPLRSGLDHYDAIAADRRALGREVRP